MRSSTWFVVLALLIVSSGCATLPRNGEPDGFQRSIAELRKDRSRVGTVPWDYANAREPEVALAQGIPVPEDVFDQEEFLSYAGMKNGQMCFLLNEQMASNDYQVIGNGDEPRFVAKRRARVERGSLYLEAFDSLSDVPTRPVLPPAGTPMLTVRAAELRLEERVAKKKIYDAQGNVARVRRTNWTEQSMEYEVCGPPPQVTQNTRYFVVSQRSEPMSLGDGDTHTLYLFVRQDELDVRSLDARGEGGAAPTAARPSTDAETASATPPSTVSASPSTASAKVAGKPRRSELMAIDGSIFAVGTPLSVTFSKPMKAAAGEKYWITVVAAASDNTAYTTFKYLAPEATRIDLDVPATTGDYEVRLHGNYPTKTYNLIDKLRFRSTQDVSKESEPENVSMAPLEVDKGAKSKLMSAAKVKLDPGAVFTVKFPKPLKAKASEKYWIAVSKVTASPEGYESYAYVEGAPPSIDLTAPGEVGEYEVRLHGNYPTKKTNIVDRFKITVR